MTSTQPGAICQHCGGTLDTRGCCMGLRDQLRRLYVPSAAPVPGYGTSAGDLNGDGYALLNSGFAPPVVSP